MSILPRCQLACLLFALAAAVPVNVNAAEGEAIIEQIRADWMERYHAYDRFIYRCEGSLIIPKHSRNIWIKEPSPEEELRPGPDLFPPEDRFLPFAITWYVDVANSRFRNETTESIFEREKLDWRQRLAVEAFDGETLWSGKSEVDDVVTLQPSSRTEWFFSYDDRPPFFAQGLFPLTTFQYGDLSKQTAKGMTFKYQGEGVINGHACQIIEITRQLANFPDRHRFYVDLTRDSAILRFEREVLTDVYHKGTSFTKSTRRFVPAGRTTMKYQEQDGFWVPKSWRSELFGSAQIGPGGSLEYKLSEATTFPKIEVELDPELPDSLFEQPLESGTIVRDHRDGKFETFQVDEDGETLVPVSRVRAPASSGWNAWMIAWGVLGIGLIVGALILRARSGRSSGAARE